MEERKELKNNLILTIFFILGFTVIFVILGAGAGSISLFILRNKQIISVIGGGIILIIGFYLVGILDVFTISIPFIFRGTKVKSGSGTVISAFLLGLVLSAAWTPCVGPILSAILVMAAAGQSVIKAPVMLFTYSIGIGFPFILGVLAYSKFVVFSNFMKRNYKGVKIISGIVLLVIGLFLILGQFQRISLVFASLPDISQTIKIKNLSLLVAFFGGIVSFASPCVLPLVPTYLAYITGVSVSQVKNINRN